MGEWNGSVETSKWIQGFPPQDINGQTLNEDYVTLKDYEHVTFRISVGNVAADFAVTLKQATDNAAAGEKALGFDVHWVSGAGDGELTKTTTVSDTFTVAAATDDNKQFFIEIDASELDVDGGFAFVRIDLADPGDVALVDVAYKLTGSRFAGATMPDPQ